MKNCPYCDELIQDNAVKCMYCEATFDEKIQQKPLAKPNRNMSIVECIVYGLKNTFNKNDRTTRREHFIYTIFMVLIIFGSFFGIIWLVSTLYVAWIAIPVQTVLIIPLIIVAGFFSWSTSAVRRLQDAFDNVLIIFLPYVQCVIFIALMTHGLLHYKQCGPIGRWISIIWFILLCIIAIMCLLFPSKK